MLRTNKDNKYIPQQRYKSTDPKYKSAVCDFCDGTRYTDCYIEQHGWVQYKCPKCNGTGKADD